MCTLIALLGLVPEYPLVVAMNRDEFYERPSRPPELRAGRPRIVMPRDARAEGTWIGVNEHGVVGGLSNRLSGLPDPSARSRGLLCLESLTHPDALAARSFAARDADTRQYNPFNLLHADPARVVCTSREGGATFVRDGAGGVNVLTNAGLNADDPRARLVLDLMRDANVRFLDTAVRSLRSALGDHADAGGRAVCHHGERTGTRSQTIVAVSDAGWTGNRLWHAEGRPCEADFLDFTSLFR